MLLSDQVHVMAPIFLTRILDHHDDLTPPTQGGQSFHHLHGQVRNTKDHNAWRQAFWFQSFCMLSLAHELRMHVGPRMALRRKLGGLGLQDIFLQQLPQLCLPYLVRRHGFAQPIVLQYKLALGPISKPICTVTLIAIKHIGNLLCQLIPLTSEQIVFDVGQQRCHLICLCKLWQ